ncbi:MAG: hypothetical protein H6825_07060 [Planctomycetes bacterium]|nr:hypothetical protein [Planctomycetota bacterium]
MRALDAVRARRRVVARAVARDRARLLRRASCAAPEIVEAARSPWAIVAGGLFGGALCGVWLARADSGRLRRGFVSTARGAGRVARSVGAAAVAHLFAADAPD